MVSRGGRRAASVLLAALVSGVLVSGVLIGGVLIGPVIGSVPTTARGDDPSARAARRSAPLAVAVTPEGAAYVGFAGGAGLVRLNARGQVRRPVALPAGTGPITGLAVDQQRRVWVDDGSRVTVLDHTGTVARTWSHRPVVSCSRRAGDPRSYGDLTIASGTVYIADRCRGTVGAYSMTGVLRALVDLPGDQRASGLAWLPAGYGHPDRLLVTVPQPGRLYVYDAERLSDRSRPLQVRKIPRVGGGHRPQPSAVVADRYGQVAVLDAANQVLLWLDGNNHFSHYRTRGYPGRVGSAAGRVRRPLALAQHAQDGSGLAGDLWVADTGNGRVQRWDTGTYTWWTAKVKDPGTSAPGSDTTSCPGPVEALVNGGERWTRTPQVSVRVPVPDGTTGLTLFHSADLTDGVAVALRGDCTYDWRLDSSDAGVWVRLDGGPSDGQVVHDGIGLDTSVPLLRSPSARYVRGDRKWRFTATVTDTGSGAVQLLLAPRRGGSATTARVSGRRVSVSVADGAALRWVRVVDRAGNASAWFRTHVHH